MSIQSIINGIPGGDDITKVKYLFSNNVIQRGKVLPNTELPVIEIELKQHYTAKIVNDWIRQVKKQKTPDKLSHIDISNLYLKQHKDDTLYARSDYHRYKDGVWSILPEIKFLEEIKQILEHLEGQGHGPYTSGHQSSIANFITQAIAKSDTDLDANPDLINLKNGTFSISSQNLLPHNPKDYITTQLLFDYKGNTKPKNWTDYLCSTFVERDVFGNWQTDWNMVALLQEAIGYSLTSSMRFHISFWCLGEGSNGKGVLFHVLDKLGGSSATAFNLDMLNQSYNTYHLAELAGKRIVYCTEVNKQFDFSGDAMFKAITGGDTIQVRQIREKPFKLQSVSKVWISFNDFPHIKDTSHGFWRRVVVIPFNRLFDDKTRDLDLKTKLEDELSGIFNWAMIGLNRLLKNENFTVCDQVTKITAKYKSESNTVDMFIQEKCTVDPSKNTIITAIYGQYREWCKVSGYHPYSRKNFSKELEKMNYEIKRLSAGISVIGLEIDIFV